MLIQLSKQKASIAEDIDGLRHKIQPLWERLNVCNDVIQGVSLSTLLSHLLCCTVVDSWERKSCFIADPERIPQDVHAEDIEGH